MVLSSLIYVVALAATPQAPTHTEFTRHGLRALEGADGSISIAAPFACRSIGIWWQGELGAAELRIYAADQSVHGTQPILANHDLAPAHVGATGPAGASRVSGLFHGDGAKIDRVQLWLPEIDQVENLSLVWIPWFAAPAQEIQAETQFGNRASYPQPPIYDRASWGADPPQCSSGTCPVTHIALHHTAGASEYSSPNWSTSAANVRAIQDYHMYTRGWCDIGYHYLVDVHGNIFEGRAGDGIRGAHDGFNCGSVSISMMGYFHTPHNQVLTPAMENAYAELAAWKCDEKNINPLGSSFYAGLGAQMTNLYGHRDVGSTACPGDLAYARLPVLRQAVEDRLTGGSGPLILDTDQLQLIGAWNTGSSASGKYGPDYRWASTGTSAATAFWQPFVPQAGRYAVQFWWAAGSNRHPAALHGLQINGQTWTAQVNQQQSGGQWVELGEVSLPRGTATRIGLNNSGPSGWVVIADALRLVPR